MEIGSVAAWIGIVANVLWGTLNFAVTRRNRREDRRAREPKLVCSHELIPRPTLKGFRRIAGVRVDLVNQGGSALWIRALMWGRDGTPLREARPDLPEGGSEDLIPLLPDRALTVATENFDGEPLNELTVVAVDGTIQIYRFELVPSRGYIAVFPGDWPPAYKGHGFAPSSHDLILANR